MIAILSLLVSILLPSLQKAKKLAKDTVCMSNTHHLGQGLLIYAHEYEGTLPLSHMNMHGYCTWAEEDIVGIPAGGRYVHLGMLRESSIIEGPDILFCPSDHDGGSHTAITKEVSQNTSAEVCGYIYRSPGPTGSVWGKPVRLSETQTMDNLAVENPAYPGPVISNLFTLLTCDGSFPSDKIPYKHLDGAPAGYSDGHVDYVKGDLSLFSRLWKVRYAPYQYTNYFGYFDWRNQ